MTLSPLKFPDWRIAEEAEQNMRPITVVAEKLGLLPEEILPHGHLIAKLAARPILARLPETRRGYYVDVTAITPTPLGEGKSTTTLGLVDGLARRGQRASAAIRQPSGGPSMNVKGSAAGGGRAQCIPLVPFTFGLTGDINAVINAHNLGMVALTARMQHERNYTDEQLLSRSDMRRLNIDPNQVKMGWVMDFCAQSLRNIIIGIPGEGGKLDGYMMPSRFDIAVSSEVMAILAVARSLNDLRVRIGHMVLAHSLTGKPITANDLEVAGAMTAWMVDAFNPNLLQTLENNPVFVHAGPFANIAIGQSSIIADQIALRCADIHVTESGFGADIGFEKFADVKCRLSGLAPDAAVVVATVRALKCHGGAPLPVPGRPLPHEYAEEHVEWVEAGCANLLAHIETVKKTGISPVVCLNRFSTDTDDEIAAVRRIAEAAGARVAVSRHWELGGEGALELADAVLDACREPKTFAPLVTPAMPFKARIDKLAREVYGADEVEYHIDAKRKLAELSADPKTAQLDLCMVKTHLSLSDDPARKGVPKDWTLYVRDVLTYHGAGFVVPVAGKISLMPGTGSDPGYRRIDIDCKTGKVTGLF
jgi:formate--tetrahydrofolate ligase